MMIYSKNLSKQIAALTPVPGSEVGNRRQVLQAITNLEQAGTDVTRKALMQETGLGKKTVDAILDLGVQKGVIIRTLGRVYFGNQIYYYSLGKTAEARAEDERKREEEKKRLAEHEERIRLDREKDLAALTPSERKDFAETIKRMNSGQPDETIDEVMEDVLDQLLNTPAAQMDRQDHIERERNKAKWAERELREKQSQSMNRIPQAMLDDIYGDEHHDEYTDAVDMLLEGLEVEEQQRRLDDDSTK